MLMSQPRQFHHHHLSAGGSGGGGQFNDTTFTKIFVGGLAWETQRDTMRNYFEQFGEILEAVVITDKSTGRSKGYGFVTFKDPEAASKACQNPAPIIDGRKANCNLASLGAQKNRPPPAHQAIGGSGRFSAGLVAPPAFPASSSTYFHLQPSTQLTFPYSAYGYSGFSHDTMYPMNYYGVYGGHHFPPYYGAGAGAGTGGSGSAGYFHNLYPYYPPYASQGGQGGHHQQPGGYGVQYHHHQAAAQMLQYSYLPHQQQLSGTPGILSLPTTPLSMPNTATGSPSAAVVVQSGAGSRQIPSQQAAAASNSQLSSTST